MEAFLRFTYDRVSVYGRDQLFEHKEFTNDIEKMRKFISLLDSSSLLNQITSSDGVRVRIGNENSQLMELDDVSIVTADITIDDESKGTISLIGPTRMDYSKVISAVEYVREQLKKFFED